MQEQLELFIEQLDESNIYYSEALAEFEKRFIICILSKYRGNQCKAALRMRMHRNTLRRRIEQLNIDVRETKKPVRSSYGRKEATTGYSSSHTS